MSGMGNIICALNKLSNVDVAFFIVCAVIIALIVAVYFLIPVINKKFYQEQRDNVRKREASFKSNLQPNNTNDPEKEADGKDSEVSKDE